MRLLILSDLHIEFGTFDVPKDIEYDVAILAGDIGVPGSKAIRWARRQSTFGAAKAVIALAGNHEFYGQVLQSELGAMRAAGDDSRVHFLDCNQYIMGGLRFLGCTLWTDFELAIVESHGERSDAQFAMNVCREALTDHRMIRTRVSEDADGAIARMLRPEDTVALHHAHRAWLAGALREPFDGPTVVVTHHAPHRGSLLPEFQDDWSAAAYVSELPKEFFEIPVLWVHGHVHASLDYRIGNCRVVCNPRGYLPAFQENNRPENERFNARLVIEV